MYNHLKNQTGTKYTKKRRNRIHRKTFPVFYESNNFFIEQYLC